MQPFENRFLRLVPDDETKGIKDDTIGRDKGPGIKDDTIGVSDCEIARREFKIACRGVQDDTINRTRSAGVPLLRPAASPQTLPRMADFTIDGQAVPTAYFLIGSDLFSGTSNQILRDIRTAASVPTASPFLYADGIFDRLRAAALRRNPAVTLPSVPAGPFNATTRIPDDWLKVGLWLAYSDAPVRLQTVRLPLQVLSPVLGGEAWTVPGSPSASSVQVSRDFDPSLLAQNPFAVYVLPTIDVESEPPVRPELASNSSSGAVLVGFGLVALLLMGGGK